MEPGERGGIWLFGGRKTALQRYLRNLLEIVILLVFLSLTAAVFVRALPYILPFVVGFLIAVLLMPMVRAMERSRIPSPVAIVLALAVTLGGLTALAAYLVVQAAVEAASLSQAVPHYFVYWRRWVEQEVHLGSSVYAHLPPKVVDALQAATLAGLDQARHFAASIFAGILAGVAFLPDLIFVTVISVVASYFFLAEREKLLGRLRRMLPPGWAPKLERVASDVGRALAGLLRAQLVLIGVTSVIGVVGLLLLRMPYAVILGLAVGFTGWVPILGSGVVTLPWAIGAFIAGHYVAGLKVLLLQAVASLVRHTIEPKILASNMGIGTFATLFGMYVGMTSIGFIGLLLGPILLIAIQSLIRARMFIDFLPDTAALPEGERKDEPRSERSEK